MNVCARMAAKRLLLDAGSTRSRSLATRTTRGSSRGGGTGRARRAAGLHITGECDTKLRSTPVHRKVTKTSKTRKRRREAEMPDEQLALSGGAGGDSTSRKTSSSSDNPSTEYRKLSVCSDGKTRCWGTDFTSKMGRYHDHVWGRPEFNRDRLFGQLCLQAFQSGLSWQIILNKEEGFRKAFHDFQIERVAAMTAADVERLMGDAAIVRNRRKIQAAVSNAQQALRIDKKHPGGFVEWIWQFAPDSSEGERLIHAQHKGHMRTDFKTKASELTLSDGVHPTAFCAAMAKSLKREGFKWVGETTILSFAQAVGMVNHHGRECFAFAEIEDAFKRRVVGS